MTQRTVSGKAYRDFLKLKHYEGCEVCGWCVPPALRTRVHQTGVHVHHVVPLVAGGTELDAANMVPLCPNHHALAHAMFPRVGGRYCGPTTRAAFLEALAQGEQNPTTWRRRLDGQVRGAVERMRAAVGGRRE